MLPEVTGSPGVPVMDVSPAVRIGEGRRPEAATHVQMTSFDGPLALLLSLIEQRQLDVLTVPLGSLADAYLEALATVEADRLGNISAFVAVASQLILIKSRAMLPRPPAIAAGQGEGEDVPDPEAELRARLLLYRAHRDAGRQLADDALLRVGLFRREAGAARASGLAGARPEQVRPIDPERLVHALSGLALVVPPPPPPPEVIPRTVTLTERARIIREALRDAPEVVLQDLLRGVRDRVVVAVTFLAMLELMKRREIVVEQSEPWGAIIARATETLADDTPLDESLESFA
ncbi:MAG TPA: segregation/condensation protein A [Candidatus Limnocylindrales bacterium]